MAEILGKEPETYACTLTAVEMARAAYRQAAHLSEFGIPILGVSCTCALATDRVKRGDHKVLFTLVILRFCIQCTTSLFQPTISDHMHPGNRPLEEWRSQGTLHSAFLHTYLFMAEVLKSFVYLTLDPQQKLHAPRQQTV